MIKDILLCLVVIVPLGFVLWMSYYSKRYVRSVADYLAAGRVCGRYVISVGDMASALGVLYLVALCEVGYKTGFALSFWQNITLPLGIFLSLTGFITYRFRETCAMSGGQFLEMRYSRKFRIFATCVRSFAELLTNCIGPAIAARFLIYLLGIPYYFEFLGIRFSSFVLLLLVILVTALFIILTGGRVALIITDSIQGMITYPIFIILIAYVLFNFSWQDEIVAVMTDRIPGESFFNPYDIKNMRDFNLFSVVAGIMMIFFNRGLWLGNGSSSCAKTPHEQKMAGLLGQWRAIYSMLCPLILVIMVITVMCHANFSARAHNIRLDLTEQVMQELPVDNKTRTAVNTQLQTLSSPIHRIGVDTPLSQTQNIDTPYLNKVHTALVENTENGNAHFQNFTTLYHQMMMPAVMGEYLPPILVAVLVLLIAMLVVSNDDSLIFNSAATLIQDLIVPFCKKPFTPEQHVKLLKFMSVVVTAVFFFGSMFLAQLDYLNLFLGLAMSIWGAGAGGVILFGFYSRYGTTAGAYASILIGGGACGGGMLIQRNWANAIYPWLDSMGWVEPVGNFLATVSAPFNPYIVWVMNPVKFPINSIEIGFISSIIAIASYWIVSFITFKKPFNLEKMLHRGKYNLNPEKIEIKEKFTFRKLFSFLLTITPDYSKGDKVIAWAIFVYSIIYTFIISFICVVLLNLFGFWKSEWWSYFFLVNTLVIPLILALVSMIWFTIGGVIDLRKMFHDLKNRQVDALDNGMVEDGVSLADKVKFATREKEREK